MMSPPPASKGSNLSEENELPTAPDRDTNEAGTDINEKALMRKIDSRLLPAVTVLYLCSFLDRSNGE